MHIYIYIKSLGPVVLLIHSPTLCKIIKYLKLEGTHMGQVLPLAGLPKSKSVTRTLTQVWYDHFPGKSAPLSEETFHFIQSGP